jgi:hypothetical protein
MDREAQKRAIYDRLSARRRKFVDRIGYDKWDPFQEPNHPIEIRTDITRRTATQLVRDFYRDTGVENPSTAYSRGVYEICMAIFTADERYKAMFDFSRWYANRLQELGVDPEQAWER